MKKILTFLVMLFATVSILSAQTTPKISYQAVVRDVNNDHNLVMDKACDVEVTVYEATNNTAIYTEQLSGTTNRNGMIALEIGSTATDDTLARIDWSNAYIEAVFTVEGKTVSTVQTPITAVPYALQAGSYELTTEQIVKYLRDVADVDAMKAIQQAIVDNNHGLKQYLKDTVINYIKAHPSDVKALGLYFLAKVDENDLDDARNAVSDETKAKIKEILKDYAKSPQGKEILVDVAKYYLQNATTDDAKALWNAARNNPNFNTFFNHAKDSVVKYITDHPELVIDIAKSYIQNATPTQVNQAYQYLKTNQPAAYTFLLNKFQNYLNYYLSDIYHAVSNKNCQNVDICNLQAQVDQILNSDCADFTGITVDRNDPSGVKVTVALAASVTFAAGDFTFFYSDGATETPITPIQEDNQDFYFENTSIPATATIVVKWRGMCSKSE